MDKKFKIQLESELVTLDAEESNATSAFLRETVKALATQNSPANTQSFKERFSDSLDLKRKIIAESLKSKKLICEQSKQILDSFEE